jgi:hypothetical protein
MADTMTGEFYLVVKKKGYYTLAGRLANKSPSLDVGEVAIKVSVKVPRGLFDRPQLQASITIPEDSITPPVLDATILDNVREVMKATMGFDVEISVVDPI